MIQASLLFFTATVTAAPAASASSETLARALFDTFNRHDAAALALLYADDARLTSSDFCGPRFGRTEVVRTYRALFERFPDIRDEVQDMVVDGDRVAVRFVATSGKGGAVLSLPIATFLTVKHGLIQTDDSMFDTAGRACEP
ncbi:MAG: nuclear transport factor 2 family protein [Dyella sp.]|nr:nuclear transport factor 2 family protein [Dyella sp.]